MLKRLCYATAFALVIIAIANAQPPRQQVKVVGKWQMAWSGSTADAEFRADGTYWCDWVDGRRWSGVWQFADDTLIVEELPPFGVLPTTWEVRLQVGSLRGDLQGGGDFELKP